MSQEITEEQQQLVDELYRAIHARDEAKCLLLIAQDCRLDVPDKHDTLPIHLACASRLENVALEMIKQGCLLDVLDKYDNLPINYACISGLENVALEMIKQGCPLYVPNNNDILPIHHACASGLENVVLEMIKRGYKIDAKCHKKSFDYDNVSDVEDQFINFVVNPIVIGGGEGVNQIGDNDLELSQNISNFIFPPPKLSEPIETTPKNIAKILRPLRLSRAWHHEGVGIPADKLPLLGNKEWNALFDGEITTNNGYKIKCLTSSDELREESKILNHCVGRNTGYDQKCCEDNHQILSISDKNGKKISTAELIISDEQQAGSIKLANGKFIRESQHKAYLNKQAPSDANFALSELMGSVKNNTLSLNLDELGETDESKERFAKIPSILQKIGYQPTDGAINNMFDEYKKDIRQTCTHYNEDGRMVYDKNGSHFIQGYSQVKNCKFTGDFYLYEDELPSGAKIVKDDKGLKDASDADNVFIDVRHLDALSYMKATGMLSVLRRNIPDSTAPELRDIWQEQDKKPISFRDPPKEKPKTKVAGGDPYRFKPLNEGKVLGGLVPPYS